MSFFLFLAGGPEADDLAVAQHQANPNEGLVEEGDQQEAVPRGGDPREDGEGNVHGSPNLQNGEVNADCEAGDESDDAASQDHGRDGDF